MAIAAGLTPIGTLGNLVSIGTLMAFVIVSFGIIVLRRTRPDLPRPFRMPLVPLLPLLSALVSLVLMLSLPCAHLGAADAVDGRWEWRSTSCTATDTAGSGLEAQGSRPCRPRARADQALSPES